MRWLALVLGSMVACSYATIPNAISFTVGYTLFDPTAWHIEQYHSVEECVGIVGDLTKVDWRVADAILQFPNPNKTVWNALKDFAPEDRKGGYWHPIKGTDRFAITLDRRDVHNMSIVRHEIVHDLLKGGDHNDPVFARCAPVG